MWSSNEATFTNADTYKGIHQDNIWSTDTLKESLNSDSHQFHQYQQNLSSYLNLLNVKKTTTYDVGNQILANEECYQWSANQDLSCLIVK
jgi:hypothetical protein